MRIPSGTTNRYVYFVAVDSTDLKTREPGLGSFTVYYEIANGAATAMTTPTVTESDATNMPGVYTLLIDESGMTTLTAGHDTAELCLHITQASMSPVTRTIEIYRVKGTEGETIGVSSGAITAVTTTTTATNVTTVNGLAANVITATSINADAITAAKVAADVTTEIWAGSTAPSAATIASAVWDLDATAHQTQGTFGQAIGDPAADTNTIYKAVVSDATGATVGVDVVAIKAETVNILTDTAEIGAAGVGLTVLATQASVDTIDNLVDDLESRLGTPSDLGSGATVAANLVDIESQTDDIGVAGAGLTALATQVSVDDLPTNAELATALGTADDAVLAQVALVKAKTDSLTFTKANELDVNIHSIVDVTIVGDGSGTPFQV